MTAVVGTFDSIKSAVPGRCARVLHYSLEQYSYNLAIYPANTEDDVLSRAQTKETREGWSLLTVKTETNGESWSTYERVKGGSFLGWFVVSVSLLGRLALCQTWGGCQLISSYQ